MSFKIITDSTADLPEKFVSENNICVVNLSYSICDKTYCEEDLLSAKEFYSLMRQGNVPATSQINPNQAKEALLKAIEENDEILYISFSSALSGSYNSARLAIEEVLEDNPGKDIKLLDSKGASLGEGLMIYKAVNMRDNGASLSEVYEYLSSHIDNFVHIFTVDDLNFLFKGGRVSKSTAIIGSVLNIKPILHVDENGKLVPFDKVRGRKKALLFMVDEMEKRQGAFAKDNDVISISHADCYEDASLLKDMIFERFGEKTVIINDVSPVIGSHSGPGTLALFFMGYNK